MEYTVRAYCEAGLSPAGAEGAKENGKKKREGPIPKDSNFTIVTYLVPEDMFGPKVLPKRPTSGDSTAVRLSSHSLCGPSLYRISVVCFIGREIKSCCRMCFRCLSREETKTRERSCLCIL